MNRLLILSFLICLFSLSSCSDKNKEIKKRVLQLKEMAELGTVEYSVSKVLLATDDQTWYKFGNRKILFSCEAIIKAGVDLTQLKNEDIEIDGGSITLKLPKPRLIYINMIPDRIKEEFSDIGMMRFSFTNQEKNQILVQGEKEILESIPSIGILDAAEKNTRILISSWLAQLNFNDVSILFVEQ